MHAVPDHVLLNTVVLDELRLVYVPVPKAATTSVLGSLFELAGLQPGDRRRSRKPEATRDLTVHDGSLWGSKHRLKERSSAEREWILESDEWFRFTVVREPARRIWSAWVSKVLVRDPRFVLMFGEDWFPPVPSSVSDVVGSFRAFVTALPDRAELDDSHWSAQAPLAAIGEIDYHHVGRVESLERTEAVVGHYVAERGGTLPDFGKDNRSLLPYSSALFDRTARDACLRLTESDRRAFGYAPVDVTGGQLDDEWLATVDACIPGISALVERHERLLDLWRTQARTEPSWLKRMGVAAGRTVALVARSGS